jgi:hypothetical protein
MKSIRSKISMIIILSLLLSGCFWITPEPIPFDTTITLSDTYYGNGHTFTVAGEPKYVEETVYRIQDEKELALLSLAAFEKGEVKVYYESTTELSLNKTMQYVSSLLPFTFALQSSTQSYKQGDVIVKEINSLEIQFDQAQYETLLTYVDAWDTLYMQDSYTILQELEVYHDQLLLNTQYDTSLLTIDLSQSDGHGSFEAIGLFETKVAVCSGYSRAYMALLKDRGVATIMVSSIAMNHAWNLVYTGSEWKYVDVTFDDPIPDEKGRALQTYFLKYLSFFEKDKKHAFDLSGEDTMSMGDYGAWAAYVFPNPLSD